MQNTGPDAGRPFATLVMGRPAAIQDGPPTKASPKSGSLSAREHYEKPVTEEGLMRGMHGMWTERGDSARAPYRAFRRNIMLTEVPTASLEPARPPAAHSPRNASASASLTPRPPPSTSSVGISDIPEAPASVLDIASPRPAPPVPRRSRIGSARDLVGGKDGPHLPPRSLSGRRMDHPIFGYVASPRGEQEAARSLEGPAGLRGTRAAAPESPRGGGPARARELVKINVHEQVAPPGVQSALPNFQPDLIAHSQLRPAYPATAEAGGPAAAHMHSMVPGAAEREQMGVVGTPAWFPLTLLPGEQHLTEGRPLAVTLPQEWGDTHWDDELKEWVVTTFPARLPGTRDQTLQLEQWVADAVQEIRSKVAGAEALRTVEKQQKPAKVIDPDAPAPYWRGPEDTIRAEGEESSRAVLDDVHVGVADGRGDPGGAGDYAATLGTQPVSLLSGMGTVRVGQARQVAEMGRDLFRVAYHELTRQVALQCHERGRVMGQLGALLREVEAAWEAEWMGKQVALEAQLAVLQQKYDAETAGLSDEVARLRAELEAARAAEEEARRAREDQLDLVKLLEHERDVAREEAKKERVKRLMMTSRLGLLEAGLKARTQENAELLAELAALKDRNQELARLLDRAEKDLEQSNLETEFEYKKGRMRTAWKVVQQQLQHGTLTSSLRKKLARANIRAGLANYLANGRFKNRMAGAEALEKQNLRLLEELEALKKRLKELEDERRKHNISGKFQDAMWRKRQQELEDKMEKVQARMRMMLEEARTGAWLLNNEPKPTTKADLYAYAQRVCQYVREETGCSAYFGVLSMVSLNVHYVAASEDNKFMVGEKLVKGVGVTHQCLQAEKDQTEVYVEDVTAPQGGHLVHQFNVPKTATGLPLQRGGAFLCGALMHENGVAPLGIFGVDSLQRPADKKVLSAREWAVFQNARATLEKAMRAMYKSDIAAMNDFSSLHQRALIFHEAVPPGKLSLESVGAKLKQGMDLKCHLEELLTESSDLRDQIAEMKSFPRPPVALLYTWYAVFSALDVPIQRPAIPLNATQIPHMWQMLKRNIVMTGKDRTVNLLGRMDPLIVGEAWMRECVDEMRPMLRLITGEDLMQQTLAAALVYMWADTVMQLLQWRWTLMKIQVVEGYEDTFETVEELDEYWKSIRKDYVPKPSPDLVQNVVALMDQFESTSSVKAKRASQWGKAEAAVITQRMATRRIEEGGSTGSRQLFEAASTPARGSKDMKAMLNAKNNPFYSLKGVLQGAKDGGTPGGSSPGGPMGSWQTNTPDKSRDISPFGSQTHRAVPKASEGVDVPQAPKTERKGGSSARKLVKNVKSVGKKAAVVKKMKSKDADNKSQVVDYGKMLRGATLL